MMLSIAGVYHFDPTGRERLKRHLEELSSSMKDRPMFIAVEWDSGLFAQVKEQRSKFRELAQEQWPTAGSDLMAILELSLGYEADTHSEVFPSSPVLWLDQGRQANVQTYAQQRLNVYRSFLETDNLPLNTETALAMFSEEARKRAQNLTESTPRDATFASLINEKAIQSQGRWAIVIVGTSHASANPGSMRKLLEDQGYSCKVEVC